MSTSSPCRSTGPRRRRCSERCRAPMSRRRSTSGRACSARNRPSTISSVVTWVQRANASSRWRDRLRRRRPRDASHRSRGRRGVRRNRRASYTDSGEATPADRLVGHELRGPRRVRSRSGAGLQLPRHHEHHRPARHVGPTALDRRRSPDRRALRRRGGAASPSCSRSPRSWKSRRPGPIGARRNSAEGRDASVDAAQQLVIVRVAGIGGGEQLVAEEDAVRPRRAGTAPAARRSSRCARRTGEPPTPASSCRAAAIVRTSSSGSSVGVPSSGVPGTCTSRLIGTLSGCGSSAASCASRPARSRRRLAHPDDAAAAHLDAGRRARWRACRADRRRCGS